MVMLVVDFYYSIPEFPANYSLCCFWLGKSYCLCGAVFWHLLLPRYLAWHWAVNYCLVGDFEHIMTHLNLSGPLWETMTSLKALLVCFQQISDPASPSWHLHIGVMARSILGLAFEYLCLTCICSRVCPRFEVTSLGVLVAQRWATGGPYRGQTHFFEVPHPCHMSLPSLKPQHVISLPSPSPRCGCH